MRIVEKALRDMPPGPVQVNPETGCPVPAAEMVDLAKVGNIVAISGRNTVACPTLEGSGRAQHASIATDESGCSSLPKRIPTATLRASCSSSNWSCSVTECDRPGRSLLPVEGANGELGFYVVSDGCGCAYRVRVRPPCFASMSALHKLLTGDMMADIVPTFGSVNMIGGELDR